MTGNGKLWKSISVRKLSSGKDPIAVIEQKARALALSAMDKGWRGPPFDPFQLADYLGFSVIPTDSVKDARLLMKDSTVRIEYNPNRNAARIRYSIAHEIAHTLFPDFQEAVRNRSDSDDETVETKEPPTDLELELLCNLAAAELLMPIGDMQDFLDKEISIRTILDLREKYKVSTEAVLLRYVKATNSSCAAFSAARSTSDPELYKIDYFIPSVSWNHKGLSKNTVIRNSSVLAECKAIGYTAHGDESWAGSGRKQHIESVAIPPYPGDQYPRIVGLIQSIKADTNIEQIDYVIGNALDPRGKGKKVITHIVNDGALAWGGRGFAMQLKKKFPVAYAEYRAFTSSNRQLLKLGNIHTGHASADVLIVSMIAQKGFGEGGSRRVVYAALADCLQKLVDVAGMNSASVHMPRIGTGQAGGEWNVIEQLIHSSLIASHIRTHVYDLTVQGV
ncbi:MAG TPA: ImmA/IrrE family metallo-endopeptidase [Gammaproteobacteria bacterium]